jgi:mRNA interferase MazF
LKRSIKRGDVYWINFDPPWGRRPAVIIQNNIGNKHADTVIVASITSVFPGKIYPVDVFIPNGLLPKKNSRVLAATITTVDKEDLGDYLATLPENVMEEVDSALMASLDLEKYRTT